MAIMTYRVYTYEPNITSSQEVIDMQYVSTTLISDSLPQPESNSDCGLANYRNKRINMPTHAEGLTEDLKRFDDRNDSHVQPG